MYWKTDLPELKDEKITESNEDYGVRVSNDPQSIYHQHFTSAQLISNLDFPEKSPVFQG